MIQEWLSRQADLELFDWRRCDTSPVPVAGRSTAPRQLRLWVRIPRGHGCLSFVSGVCSEGYCQHAFNCLGYIQKYADSGIRTKTHYVGSSPTIGIFLYVVQAFERVLTVTFRTHTTHKGQTSMPPVGFEPTISAGEGPYNARPLGPAIIAPTHRK